MALKEQDILFTTKDENGDIVIQMPITRAGNIEDVMSIEQGGTGSETASGARTNLGLETAITDASISGNTITLTSADGSTKTLITQDTAPFTGVATSIGGASATKPAVVVTTYKSGTSWYRVWSDGWVEQGGYVNKTRDVACTITLPKAMKDTNYTTANGMFYGNGDNNPAMITSISTTSITMKTASWGYGLSWYVCGQGA